MQDAGKKMKESAAAEMDAQAQLVSNTLLQTRAAIKLLQLNLQEHDLQHTLFNEQKDEVQTEIERLQKVLAQQEANGNEADCEATRGELVAQKAKLEATADALKDCLSA